MNKKYTLIRKIKTSCIIRPRKYSRSYIFVLSKLKETQKLAKYFGFPDKIVQYVKIRVILLKYNTPAEYHGYQKKKVKLSKFKLYLKSVLIEFSNFYVYL